MKTLRLFVLIATLMMALFVMSTASFADGGASEDAKAPAIIEANDTLGAPQGAEAGCGAVCPDLYLQVPHFLSNGMLSIWVQNKGNANAGGFWIRVRRMSDLQLLNQVWVPSLTKGQSVNKITFPGVNASLNIGSAVAAAPCSAKIDAQFTGVDFRGTRRRRHGAAYVQGGVDPSA